MDSNSLENYYITLSHFITDENIKSSQWLFRKLMISSLDERIDDDSYLYETGDIIITRTTDTDASLAVQKTIFICATQSNEFYNELPPPPSQRNLIDRFYVRYLS
jgi:hypothetical protein